MNYRLKQALLAVGLLIPYWGFLFNYAEETNRVLQVLGAWYVGLVMFKVIKWLAPEPKEAKNV